MCQNFEIELCIESWLQLKVLQVTKFMYTLKGRRFYDLNYDSGGNTGCTWQVQNTGLMQMLATVDTVAGLNVRLHWNFFKGDWMEKRSTAATTEKEYNPENISSHHKLFLQVLTLRYLVYPRNIPELVW